MLKDKLTIHNINKDLRNLSKNAYIEIIVISLVFVGVLWLVVFTSKLTFSLSLFFYWFLCCCGEAALLVVLIRKTKKAIKVHKGYKNDKIIVRDKLINTEIKSTGFGRSKRTYYYLHFSQYGAFTIPDEIYKWSSTYAMSNSSFCKYYANCGDEFYLVLSKPHTGKILYAYNTKMFEME